MSQREVPVAATALPLTPQEKLAAVREWVESGIEKTLADDPSGFLLGIESATILDTLDEIAEALR